MFTAVCALMFAGRILLQYKEKRAATPEQICAGEKVLLIQAVASIHDKSERCNSAR